MTHDTRVVDWLGHSGASLKMGRFGGEIYSFSQQRPWFIEEALFCSGVPQAVVSTTYDWIFLYIYRKPIGLVILLRNSRKSYKLVTYIVNYHLNTDFVYT